ncbi:MULTISPECIES: TetR/AcrR family transcriptional regulator [unclassified Pseudactinotalea]|uniref:TetR/AcrR family transcriptional regulator n=1 Tax=unclassified Pseudactinotalea TaxID=2649176 RepID=UPI00128C943F|nr:MULTISPECIES: TetR/AcrR family transcriptional regulator [unclassified Pseudactinotalea]MPV50382.1 TetR family transcriptional regulator [Pseudactinotalea sp. HY160]QGH68977.1 TetR family transcriptional regulator [Pseudactinotalea sp. HY158]
MERPYHHGDLRARVLAIAAEVVAESGVDALSLRELARRAGVSHAAPAHHFGNRRGLVTALATEGFHLLAATLEPSVAAGEFDRTAVAYVRFALSHPGHYGVMFRSDLLATTDDALADARRRTTALLDSGLASVPGDRLLVGPTQARQCAWALVHGLATLWLGGALPGTDPERLTLAAAHQLFGDATAGTEAGRAQ